MAPGYEPAAGIRSFLSGTPPIIALSAVDAGVGVVAEAGIDAIRAKGIALTEYAIELADARLADLGVSVASPRDAARRGAHVALAHPDARRPDRRPDRAPRGPGLPPAGRHPVRPQPADHAVHRRL